MTVHQSPKAPLLLTLGEPGGIGPELTLKIWHERASNGTPPFVFLANKSFLESRKRLLGLDVPLIMWTPDSRESVCDLFQKALPVFELGYEVSDKPCIADAMNAKAVIAAIEEAVGMIHKGHGRAIITNPINKKSLYDAGFNHPGHTEFLGDLSKLWPGGPFKPVMMLAGPELRTVPATLHIPLKDVPQALDGNVLSELIEITHHALVERFGLSSPAIVVAGLNPHAGEDGLMGIEDDTIIRPAIMAARDKGINVTGPHPADTLFYKQRRATYDAAIAMYHDQALLPVKTIAFDETVNVTIGLPFIRTSPDHGTALDIAGKNIARPDSLLAALKMADTMACNTLDIAQVQ